MSVTNVDLRLGWLQRQFQLTASELREIITAKPKLATLPLKIISDIRFGLKEFLEFEEADIKSFIKSYPRLFTKDYQIIQSNFTFLTQVAKLTHNEIAVFPPILCTPQIILKSRYAYLKHLDRLQLDPTKPNFVSLKSLTQYDDNEFCRKTAKTNLDDYKAFLRTL